MEEWNLRADSDVVGFRHVLEQGRADLVVTLDSTGSMTRPRSRT
jgi:hypothetical protein